MGPAELAVRHPMVWTPPAQKRLASTRGTSCPCTHSRAAAPRVTSPRICVPIAAWLGVEIEARIIVQDRAHDLENPPRFVRRGRPARSGTAAAPSPGRYRWRMPSPCRCGLLEVGTVGRIFAPAQTRLFRVQPCRNDNRRAQRTRRSPHIQWYLPGSLGQSAVYWRSSRCQESMLGRADDGRVHITFEITCEPKLFFWIAQISPFAVRSRRCADR